MATGASNAAAHVKTTASLLGLLPLGSNQFLNQAPNAALLAAVTTNQVTPVPLQSQLPNPLGEEKTRELHVDARTSRVLEVLPSWIDSTYRAAGILCYGVDSGNKIQFLLGLERRTERGSSSADNYWNIFGGKREESDNCAENTALRELHEELSGVLSHVYNELPTQLSNANTPKLWEAQGKFVLFVVRVPFDIDLPKKFMDIRKRTSSEQQRHKHLSDSSSGLASCERLIWVDGRDLTRMLYQSQYPPLFEGYKLYTFLLRLLHSHRMPFVLSELVKNPETKFSSTPPPEPVPTTRATPMQEEEEKKAMSESKKTTASSSASASTSASTSASVPPSSSHRDSEKDTKDKEKKQGNDKEKEHVGKDKDRDRKDTEHESDHRHGHTRSSSHSHSHSSHPHRSRSRSHSPPRSRSSPSKHRSARSPPRSKHSRSPPRRDPREYRVDAYSPYVYSRADGYDRWYAAYYGTDGARGYAAPPSAYDYFRAAYDSQHYSRAPSSSSRTENGRDWYSHPSSSQMYRRY